MRNSEKVYLHIKEVMQKKGITNVWLAKQLGCTKECISRIVTNNNTPSISTILKIAELLEVSVDILFYGYKEEKPIIAENKKSYIAIGSYYPDSLELIIEIREKDTNRVVVIGHSLAEIAVACFEKGITKEQIEIKVA